MIVVLYQSGCDAIASKTAETLVKAFDDKVGVTQMSADPAGAWPGDVSWDDLLIVVFGSGGFPVAGNTFIEDYLSKRPNGALLLPVSIEANSRKPPDAARAIKALPHEFGEPASDERLVKRVGAMLGLRLQGRDGKIFISYRAKDGTAIARQIHTHFTSLGHHAFLDEALELDGETRILPGTPVQHQINEALRDANLLLLVDTPAAPDSPWIKHEVDTADALLVPILPLCFRDAGDKKQGPRFRSLVALQRWVPFVRPADSDDPPLSASQLDEIVEEAETYLCEVFCRKCRVPFIVEREFVSHGFAWKTLDKRLLMFESSKSHGVRLNMKVMSHCSLFDQIYSPAIKRFNDFLESSGRGNFSLFIYDGELLPAPQLEEIVKAHTEDVIILHNQELAALLDSNFTVLGASVLGAS